MMQVLTEQQALDICRNEVREHPERVVSFLYRNWRDTVARRYVLPRYIQHGQPDRFYPEAGWRLEAYDLERHAFRRFDLANMGVLRPALATEVDPLVTSLPPDGDVV